MYQLFYLLDLANFCRVNNVPPEDVLVWYIQGEPGYWFSLAPGAEERRAIRRMYAAPCN